MSGLIAFFNLGPAELLVLALCLGLPALGGIIALVVVLSLRKKDEAPDE
jgi:hypothetical protein